MKVLIVDDSPQSVAIIKVRLANEGYEILSARNGAEGLEMARRNRPDLILLDVEMPDMSGFDVCRALKEDPDLDTILVVFLTVADMPEYKARGLDLGAVDYVTKPFDAVELQARVRAALRTKRLQDLLIQHARIDPLTELWNRRALIHRLRQEWARTHRYSGSMALVMCDLDHFKAVNDAHGHSAGDRLLREAATVLLSCCRQSDFAARYGGEEFLIVAPEQDADGAAILAERCRARIEEIRLPAKTGTLAATASFGVAASAAFESDHALLQAADEALYRAKRLGRNRVEVAGAPRQEPAPSGH